MTLILIICAIFGGVAAALTIAGTVTERGKRMWRRFRARLANRPVAPRTNVHIEPDRPYCYWSQSPHPTGDEGMHVAFELHCVATNLSPTYEVRLMDAELKGVEGHVAWQALNSVVPEVGMVTGVTLPPRTPVEMMAIVVLEREALPRGPQRARMIVRDHLGNRYRTPKVTFQDGTIGTPSAQPPATAP